MKPFIIGPLGPLRPDLQPGRGEAWSLIWSSSPWGIALQPFRLSAFILILSAKGGARKGLGFILGWLACLVLVVAVVVLVTGGKPVRFRTVPSTAVLIIRLALGVALIVVAAVTWRRRNRPRRAPAWLARLDTMSPWTAAVIAAQPPMIHQGTVTFQLGTSLVKASPQCTGS